MVYQTSTTLAIQDPVNMSKTYFLGLPDTILNLKTEIRSVKNPEQHSDLWQKFKTPCKMAPNLLLHY